MNKSRGITLMNFGGCQRVPCEIFVSVNILLLSNSSLGTVLGSVNCPAEAHSTTSFALRNGKFSRLGGGRG